MMNEGTSVAPADDTSGPTRRSWRGLGLLLAVALVAWVAVSFAPAAGNGFVVFDDDENFLDNPNFRGLGPGPIAWAWSTFLLGVYQPLAWMLMEVEYVLWGLDPRGYHLASIGLHAAVSVVVYALTVALLDRTLPGEERRGRLRVHASAAMATAAFAVHPLRVEVVAWASCQPYLPCALFYVLSVLAYLRANPEGNAGVARTRWLAISWGLFLAALLCKAVAVTLPAVLVILDAYPLRRLGPGRGGPFGPVARAAWPEKVPFAALGLAFVAVTVWAKSSNDSLSSVREYGPAVRVFQTCYGACFYLLKTVAPTGLSAYYPMPRPLVWSEPRFLASLAVASALTVAALVLARRYPGLLAAWAAYLATAAPNLGLVRIGNQIAADRYAYVPAIPWVVLAAYGLARLAWRPRRLAATVAAVLLLLSVATAMTRDQCRSWRTTEILWARVIRHEGRHPTALFNLGADLERRGRHAEAKALFLETLRIDPDSPDAHNLLGAALDREGRPDEAMAEYAAAVRLEPDYPAAHNDLGSALARRGRLDEAATHFARAVRLKPNFPLARENLALASFRLGRLGQATEQYAELARYRPDSPKVLVNYGLTLARLGRIAEAAEQFAEAVRVAPGDPRPRLHLGLALIQLGRPAEAVGPLAEAARLDPRSADIRSLLGDALSGSGRPTEALAHHRAALAIDPAHPRARRALGELPGDPPSP